MRSFCVLLFFSPSPFVSGELSAAFLGKGGREGGRTKPKAVVGGKKTITTMSVWYFWIGMNAFCLNSQPNVGQGGGGGITMKKNNNESFGENTSLSSLLTMLLSTCMSTSWCTSWVFFYTHTWDKQLAIWKKRNTRETVEEFTHSRQVSLIKHFQT